jgi:elongation factor G
MSLAQLRNIGIVAHIDAGKTTVSERMLFYSGVERRMGEVHEGSAVMDWMEEERRRGITITAAATSLPWRDHTINLIDTPGHVDFTVEVERCMRVLDGAVLVVNGVAGVQAQSETVWRQMLRHGVSCVAFVNQLDRAGADFLAAVEDLRKRLDVPAIPVQLPIGNERGFRTVVDLLTGEALEFDESDLGREPHRVDAPARLADEIGVLRSELIEALAEEDEDILNAFMEEREPDPESLRRALRKRVVERTLMPVLCGAALRNVGIQPLLDAVIDYLPSPAEAPPVQGTHAKTGEVLTASPDPDAPLCALAFKLMADPNEDLLFARIYSGTLKPGQKVYNPRVGRMERIARLLRMHADTRHALDQAGPGDIVAVSGCKLSVTGDTLTEHDTPIVLESLSFPETVITRVVEPKTTGERDKLRAALDRLAFEDPSFHVREDEETGQWLIAGMGELHLEIKEHRLAEEFRLEVRVGRPRVAYREAPVTSGRGSGKVDKVLGGNRVSGSITLEVRPADADGGEARAGGQAGPAQVLWEQGGTIPDEQRATVEEALVLEAQAGPRFGYPMVSVTIAVLEAEAPADREGELGLSLAASAALRQALQEARVALLEPLMAFEIEAPAEFMSGIIGELNAKKANISDLEVEGDLRRVVGEVPLFPMFGYASTLRSLSQGRASFSLFPAGFREVAEEELEARGLVWE